MPSEPFLSEIYMAGLNFEPRGYALCNGQLLSISQNTALFSLLGTTFGGDGRTTFALPDLRGRIPVGMGKGPGLTNRTLGELGGEESITLTTNQIPQHNHPFHAMSEAGTTSAPSGAYLANTGALDKEYRTAGTMVTMNTNVVGTMGGTQPHDNMPPYIVLNFYIALEGIFPSRY